jgi:hypothetical protein
MLAIQSNVKIFPHGPTPFNEEFLTRLFFEVASSPEPYYNPANLEKASIGVKEKESIHQIE